MIIAWCVSVGFWLAAFIYTIIAFIGSFKCPYDYRYTDSASCGIIFMLFSSVIVYILSLCVAINQI